MSEQKWFEYYLTNLKEFNINSVVHILSWYGKHKVNVTPDFLQKISDFGFHPYIIYVLQKVEFTQKESSLLEGWIALSDVEINAEIHRKNKEIKNLKQQIAILTNNNGQNVNQLPHIKKQKKWLQNYNPWQVDHSDENDTNYRGELILAVLTFIIVLIFLFR